MSTVATTGGVRLEGDLFSGAWENRVLLAQLVALRKGAVDIAEEARRTAPVRTGRLAAGYDAKVVRKGDAIVGKITNDAPYVYYVEYGGGRPRKRRARTKTRRGVRAKRRTVRKLSIVKKAVRRNRRPILRSYRAALRTAAR